MIRRLFAPLVLCTLFILNGCIGKVDTIEHIEAFAIQTSEQNSEGFWETNGYKTINSVIVYKESKHHLDMEQKMVEDFYDLDGSYIKTIVTDYTYSEGSVSGLEKEYHEEHELETPSTILVPDSFELNDRESYTTNLDAEERTKVKEHVLSLLRDLQRKK